MEQKRYHFWIIPNPKRFPRYRRHWLRFAGIVLAFVLVTSMALVGLPWLKPRLSCRDGVPSPAIWSEGGECVGVSGGTYAFRLDQQFGAVLAKIDEQNRKARNGETACPKDTAPVAVGVLSTLASPDAAGRAVHELEGFAAAQAGANGSGCVRPIVLNVANMGADEQAAVPVAHALKDNPDIVAVVGLGLSHERSAEAANLLGKPEATTPPVPMVAGLITAEGFDRDGSKTDSPDFSTCNSPSYREGVGGGYFYRVAYRNAVQVGVLARYLGRRPDFIVTPTDKRDPYTCTSLPSVRSYQYRDTNTGGLIEVRFDPNDEPTVRQAAERICRQYGPVTAFYTARSRDLARFMASIDGQYKNGLCQASSITVVSTSDAERLRASEPDSALEELRVQALQSEVFRNGTLRVVYTPLADADSLRNRDNKFVTLERKFTELGFDVAHLDSGWAINAYDALLIVSEAVRTLHTDAPPTRGQVNSAISSFSSGYARLGAGGPISFDNSANREGEPEIVQLCPTQPEGRPFTVPADGSLAGNGSLCPEPDKQDLERVPAS